MHEDFTKYDLIQDSSTQVPTGYIRVSINWYKQHNGVNGMLILDSMLNGITFQWYYFMIAFDILASLWCIDVRQI